MFGRIQQLSTSDASSLTVLFLLCFIGTLAAFVFLANRSRPLWVGLLIAFFGAAVVAAMPALLYGGLKSDRIATIAVTLGTMLALMFALHYIGSRNPRSSFWGSAVLLAASLFAVLFTPSRLFLRHVIDGVFFGSAVAIGYLFQQYKKTWQRR